MNFNNFTIKSQETEQLLLEISEMIKNFKAYREIL